MISAREEQVLQLVADGLSLPEVAAALFISVKTVKNHLASIYAKLDARDRTQAVLRAVRMGIIRLELSAAEWPNRSNGPSSPRALVPIHLVSTEAPGRGHDPEKGSTTCTETSSATCRPASNIKNERGAALVEYALLLALIAVVCIVALTTLGGKASSKFESIGNTL